MPNLRGQITISEALSAINPDAKTIIHGDDIDTCRIEWKEDTAEIDKADIKVKITELQAEYDAQEYARQREAEYPSIKELVVALYDTEDKAAIDAKRAEIKKKYPKGAS